MQANPAAPSRYLTARTVLATLQGALFVALSLQEPAAFDAALEGLIAGLRARAGASRS